MNESRDAFRHGLGARIDALEGAARDLESGDGHAVSTIKQVAHSLHEHATDLDMLSLQDCAGRVSSAPDHELVGLTQDLITLMRLTAAEGPIRESLILVVGGDKRTMWSAPGFMPRRVRRPVASFRNMPLFACC
ncbi:MAG: hypothetical protein O3A51_03575 [Verrucomicrobia bacterium]|nr:hypothetical protein [Verrucomicrobiota bacterium]